jgi:hypothetical protein
MVVIMLLCLNSIPRRSNAGGYSKGDVYGPFPGATAE